MYYIVFNSNMIIEGIYENSSEIKEPYLTIDDDLYNHIISIQGRKQYTGMIDDIAHDIRDADKFVLYSTEIPKEKTEVEKLQDKVLIQDELINVTMMATDEIFVMIEPLLASQPVALSTTPTRHKRSLVVERQPMVDLYVAMIQRKLKKDVSEIPERYREDVSRILAVLEK